MKKTDKSVQPIKELNKRSESKTKAQRNKKLNSTEKYYLSEYHFKKVKVKRGLNGLGLFTEEPIKKGELIVEYFGEIINDKQADERASNKYIFSVSKNHNIDGSQRANLARYCNHACKPNAESEIKKKKVFVRAIKNITAGQEITYDYGEEYFKEFLQGHCACGAKKHLYSK